MMIYLTGASYSIEKTSDNPQADATKSLGGFMSSTPVPSGNLNELFGDVTNEDILNGKSETIAIALVNEFSETVTNITASIEMPEDAVCKFEICAIKMSADKKMESISRRSQEPLVSDFHPLTEEPLYLLSELEPNQAVGLWLKRTVLKSEIETDEQILERYLDGNQFVSVENVVLTIEFDQ